MKTLEQIKNEYARKHDYMDFSDMVYVLGDYAPIELEEKFEEVMKIYAMECLKLASENVKMKTKSNIHELSMNDDWSEIDKESITNEKNIIK